MATKTNTEINGKKYYRIRRTVGYEFVDGKKKPIQKSFYGSSKTDAEKMYDRYLKEQARLQHEDERMKSIASFNMRAREFIDTVLKPSDKYAAGTKKKYEAIYDNHIHGTWLDKMVARDIKAADIQQFYNEAIVSKGVIDTIHKFLTAMYRWMSRSGYAYDVMSAVEKPQKVEVKIKNEIVVWTDEELDTIKSGLEGRRDKFLFLLLIYTGVRISEALGLKYSDIYDDMIHIRRQYNSDHIVSLKTPSSRRDIPLHPVLKEALAEHEALYRQGDYIFTTKSGELYNDGNLRRAAYRYYKKIGLENADGKAFHVFRSTFCTNLCRKKVPLEVAANLLGHKSVEVTARFYRFVEQEAKRDAINALS